MQAQSQELEQTAALLQAKTEEHEALQRDATSLESNLATAQAAIEDLQQSSSGVQGAAEEQLEAALRNVDVLRAELEGQKGDFQTHEAQRKTTEHRLAQLEHENQRLSAELLGAAKVLQQKEDDTRSFHSDLRAQADKTQRMVEELLAGGHVRATGRGDQGLGDSKDDEILSLEAEVATLAATVREGEEAFTPPLPFPWTLGSASTFSQPR